MSILPLTGLGAGKDKQALKPMQKFFDFEKLSPEQKMKLPASIEKFHQVQKMNIAKGLDKMRQEGTYTKADAEALEAKFKGFKPDEYSKLFDRILKGEDALDAPPPKAFGYPSYELVDEKFSLIAEFGGLRTQGTARSLVICGELWELVSFNDVAKKLLGFEKYFRSCSEKPESTHWDMVLDPQRVVAKGFKGDAKETLMAVFTTGNPRFIVRDSNWGYYELVVRRSVMVGDLSEALEDIERLKAQEGGLKRTVRFSDVCTNLEVTGIADDGITGIRWVTVEMDSWHLSRIPGWKPEDAA